MATLISELRDELASLEAAIVAYAKEPTRDGCELICIQSRAAVATFEELACWSQSIDQKAQSQLVAILTRASNLLDENLAADDPAYRYAERVRYRRDRVAKFELAMLDPRLPLPT